MPLLEVTQTRHVSASIRLTDSTANQIDQYASFIRASADDVIEEALKHCFLKDREFQEFLKSPDAQKTASTLRIRKPVVNDAAKRSTRKPISPTSTPPQTPASAAGSKA
jgi:hypothetical protein